MCRRAICVWLFLLDMPGGKIFANFRRRMFELLCRYVPNKRRCDCMQQLLGRNFSIYSREFNMHELHCGVVH